MNDRTERIDVDSVERLASMSADEVNDLPYGFLILDREGVVRLYNRYESRMSRLDPRRVVGRNWFRDIAPCTRVEAFLGRFQRLLHDPAVTSERFAFRFHFMHGAQDVTVQMTRAPDEGGSVFMTVVRQNVIGDERPRPSTATLDDTRGALVGPAGIVLPLPAGSVARLMSEAKPEHVRALGAEVGRSIAEQAQGDAAAVGEKNLAAAPPMLLAGVLDASLARSGFGRLALDMTGYGDRGCIGVTVRPPTTDVTPGLVTFYEGLLATALLQSLRQLLVVRCLDRQDPTVFPWLFAAVKESLATALDDADH
jgi:photoactive yellow protein